MYVDLVSQNMVGFGHNIDKEWSSNAYSMNNIA